MRIAKAELEALTAAASYFEEEGLPIAKSLKSLLAKFNSKAKDATEGGLAPSKIEFVLVEFSAGKVVPVVAARDLFWIRQYQTWKQLQPTETQVQVVAKWLATQSWMSPMTIDQVARQWPSFLARSAAGTKVFASQARKEFTGEE